MCLYFTEKELILKLLKHKRVNSCINVFFMYLGLYKVIENIIQHVILLIFVNFIFVSFINTFSVTYFIIEIITKQNAEIHSISLKINR